MPGAPLLVPSSIELVTVVSAVLAAAGALWAVRLGYRMIGLGRADLTFDWDSQFIGARRKAGKVTVTIRVVVNPAGHTWRLKKFDIQFSCDGHPVPHSMVVDDATHKRFLARTRPQHGPHASIWSYELDSCKGKSVTVSIKGRLADGLRFRDRMILDVSDD